MLRWDGRMDPDRPALIFHLDAIAETPDFRRRLRTLAVTHDGAERSLVLLRVLSGQVRSALVR
jgi:hypothetical protein